MLVSLALLVAMVLAIPGIGYFAVRNHFSEIQLNRWDGTEDSGGRRLSMWCHSGLKNTHPHNPERFGVVEFD